MSRHPLAARNPAIAGPLATAACALALALAAGPALAQTQELDRVEVRGHIVEAPVRYDVHAHCANLDDQIGLALDDIWTRIGVQTQVKVQFLMQDGRIEAVRARGRFGVLAREAAAAVRQLDCGPQATAEAQIYRFTIDFSDTPGRLAAVAGQAAERVARVSD